MIRVWAIRIDNFDKDQVMQNLNAITRNCQVSDASEIYLCGTRDKGRFPQDLHPPLCPLL